MSALPSRARFAGSLSQPLAPEGWGSGITIASPRRSCSFPIASVSVAIPSSRRSASPPTVTIRSGRSSSSSQSRQKAQRSCSRHRRPVAAAGGSPAGIAARDRPAVERLVQRVAVEPEPPAQCLDRHGRARAAARALDDPGRLAEEVRALAVERRAHRPRLELVAGLEAGAAAALSRWSEGSERYELRRLSRRVTGRADPSRLPSESSARSRACRSRRARAARRTRPPPRRRRRRRGRGARPGGHRPCARTGRSGPGRSGSR